MALFRSSSAFDRLLERATSHLLLEPDWNAILAICDSIRSGDTSPKYAVSAIKKKFYHDNPHVVIYALEVSFLFIYVPILARIILGPPKIEMQQNPFWFTRAVRVILKLFFI